VCAREPSGAKTSGAEPLVIHITGILVFSEVSTDNRNKDRFWKGKVLISSQNAITSDQPIRDITAIMHFQVLQGGC